MKSRKSFAFTTELILLFVILAFAAVVTADAFVKSRSRSLYAERLTGAVLLAQNSAEAASAYDSIEGLAEALEGMYGAGAAVTAGPSDEASAAAGSGSIYIENVGEAAAGDEGSYSIRVDRVCSRTAGGLLIEDTINVYEEEAGGGDRADPIYSLGTAHRAGREAAYEP